MKTCTICKETKEYVLFYKDKSRRDGYLNRCKQCDREMYRRNKEKNPEIYKRMADRYYAKHRAEKLAYAKEWRKNNKIKSNAHHQVRMALKHGVLERKPCYCGDVNSDAHHPDYNHPLQVEWLCRKHHIRKHFNN